MKCELNKQDIAELSGRLDALVRLGGLVVCEQVMGCLKLIEAAIARAQDAPAEVGIPTPDAPGDFAELRKGGETLPASEAA